MTSALLACVACQSIGVPLASYASRCMLGETLEQIGFTEEVHVPCEP
ncbi:hypothetical protein [uncultured Fibrobacter sp.]|nr:hypothetical protein [uncultured Fibrobacter sp.]